MPRLLTRPAKIGRRITGRLRLTSEVGRAVQCPPFPQELSMAARKQKTRIEVRVLPVPPRGFESGTGRMLVRFPRLRAESSRLDPL